jgi:hypothetical protein
MKLATMGATQAQPTPQPQDGQPQGGDEEESNVTPEEQAEYEKFVTNGLHVIYSGGEEGKGAAVRPDILHQLNQGDDPIGNLANTTVRIVVMLQTSAQKANDPVSDDVLMHGGKALLEELAEVSEAAGIHTYSEKEMEGAWYRGLDLWRDEETKAGNLNPDDLKEQFGQIQQADQEGKLNELLPGIDAVTKGAQPQQQGGQ